MPYNHRGLKGKQKTATELLIRGLLICISETSLEIRLGSSHIKQNAHVTAESIKGQKTFFLMGLEFLVMAFEFLPGKVAFSFWSNVDSYNSCS